MKPATITYTGGRTLPPGQAAHERCDRCSTHLERLLQGVVRCRQGRVPSCVDGWYEESGGRNKRCCCLRRSPLLENLTRRRWSERP
jgi:hypothetical protein